MLAIQCCHVSNVRSHVRTIHVKINLDHGQEGAQALEDAAALGILLSRLDSGDEIRPRLEIF
jgi:hypothetical protein